MVVRSFDPNMCASQVAAVRHHNARASPVCSRDGLAGRPHCQQLALARDGHPAGLDHQRLRDASHPRRPGARRRDRCGGPADPPGLHVQAGRGGRAARRVRVLPFRQPDPERAGGGARRRRGRCARLRVRLRAGRRGHPAPRCAPAGRPHRGADRRVRRHLSAGGPGVRPLGCRAHAGRPVRRRRGGRGRRAGPHEGGLGRDADQPPAGDRRHRRDRRRGAGRRRRPCRRQHLRHPVPAAADRARRRPRGRPRSGPRMSADAPLTRHDVSAPEPGAHPAAPELGSRRPVLAAVPRPVQVAAAWAWRILVMMLALAVVVVVMAFTKVIWVPVVIALLLTVLLSPFVNLLQHRLRFPRGAAAATAVVALLAVVAGLLAVAGRQIVLGFGELWAQTSAGLEKLLVSLAESPLGIDRAQIDAYLARAGDQLSANSGTLVSGALSVTVTVGHVLAGALVTLFCAIFFLKDGPLIWAWLVRLLPIPARMPVYEASRRGLVTLAAFTRTQILVALIDAVGIGLGAVILRIPLAIPLAVLVFLASFIPFVGAIATGAIAVLVALVDQGTGSALIMLAVVVAVQQIESHLLQPLLLGHAVSLHPVAVLLSVATGSLAAGVVGALLAVPFVATLNTAVLYLRGRDKFPQLGQDRAGLTRWRTQRDGPSDTPAIATDEAGAAGPPAARPR